MATLTDTLVQEIQVQGGPQFQREMNNAAGAISQWGEAGAAAAGTLGTAFRAIEVAVGAAAGAVTAFVGLVARGIAVQNEYTIATIRLNVALRSETQALQATREAFRIAAVSPFQTQQVVNTMVHVAPIVQLTGRSLRDVTKLTMDAAAATGKTGEELEIFANNIQRAAMGSKEAMRYLSETTGGMFAFIPEAMQLTGQMPAQAVMKSLEAFRGAAAAMAATPQGALTTLKDVFDLFAKGVVSRDAGDQVEDVTTKFVRMILTMSNMIDEAEPLRDSLRDLAEKGMGYLEDAMGTLLPIAMRLTKELSNIANKAAGFLPGALKGLGTIGEFFIPGFSVVAPFVGQGLSVMAGSVEADKRRAREKAEETQRQAKRVAAMVAENAQRASVSLRDQDAIVADRTQNKLTEQRFGQEVKLGQLRGDTARQLQITRSSEMAAGSVELGNLGRIADNLERNRERLLSGVSLQERLREIESDRARMITEAPIQYEKINRAQAKLVEEAKKNLDPSSPTAITSAADMLQEIERARTDEMSKQLSLAQKGAEVLLEDTTRTKALAELDSGRAQFAAQFIGRQDESLEAAMRAVDAYENLDAILASNEAVLKAQIATGHASVEQVRTLYDIQKQRLDVERSIYEQVNQQFERLEQMGRFATTYADVFERLAAGRAGVLRGRVGAFRSMADLIQNPAMQRAAVMMELQAERQLGMERLQAMDVQIKAAGYAAAIATAKANELGTWDSITAAMQAQGNLRDAHLKRETEIYDIQQRQYSILQRLNRELRAEMLGGAVERARRSVGEGTTVGFGGRLAGPVFVPLQSVINRVLRRSPFEAAGMVIRQNNVTVNIDPSATEDEVMDTIRRVLRTGGY